MGSRIFCTWIKLMVLMRVMLLLPPKTRLFLSLSLSLSLFNLLILWLHLCVASATATSAAILSLCQLLSLPSLQKSIKLRKPEDGVCEGRDYYLLLPERFEKTRLKHLRPSMTILNKIVNQTITHLKKKKVLFSFLLLVFVFSPVSRVSHES